MGNAYDNASLIVTPNAYKASKIYALKPTDGSGDLSFSRAGSKMVRNSSGLWETIGTNIPPLHYPVGGGCPSWLFEAEATNVLQQSNNIASSPWQGTEMPVMQGASNNISGVNDYSILEGVGFGYARIYQDIASAIYTFSIRIKFKTGGRSWFKVDTTNLTFFNIELGTIGNVGAGCTASIKDDGNGYYLCTVTETVARTRVYIGATTGNGTDGFVGDGRESFLISNTQLETGATATSPIITAGSSVTRFKDVPTKSGIDAFLGLQECTIFIHVKSLKPATNNAYINCIDTGVDYTVKNIIGVLKGNSSNTNKIVFVLFKGDGTADQYFQIISTNTFPNEFKAAFIVKSGASKLIVNGAVEGSSNVNFTITQMGTILSINNQNVIYAHLGNMECKPVQIYTTALSDSEAIALTTL